jgi:hypothetical protein
VYNILSSATTGNFFSYSETVVTLFLDVGCKGVVLGPVFVDSLYSSSIIPCVTEMFRWLLVPPVNAAAGAGFANFDP